MNLTKQKLKRSSLLIKLSLKGNSQTPSCLMIIIIYQSTRNYTKMIRAISSHATSILYSWFYNIICFQGQSKTMIQMGFHYLNKRVNKLTV